MINAQFYPTPPDLVKRMWSKIKGRAEYLLEPSAGRGNIILNHRNKYTNCDCIEIDLDNAAILRSKGLTVVGSDFLTFTTAKQYSACLMNPPFSNGVTHVMHAYDNVLSAGQIVALVNAENIRNPNDKQKQRLVNLLQDEGNEVEFIQSAFMHEDVERKTNVEVALLSLFKTRNVELDYTFLQELKRGDFPDTDNEKIPDIDHSTENQIAIPQSVIARAVLVYNAACRALRREIEITNALRSTTGYYSNLLEQSILQSHKDDGNPESQFSTSYHDRHDETLDYNRRLDFLKERGWSTVLKQTDIGKGLSSAVMKDLTSKFEQVKNLEFTEDNILSFLRGLVAQNSDMQQQMLNDVHRAMVSYGHENQIYYKGWKSNDKHRVAFRIRSTRIILPLRRSSFSSSISYSELDTFRDIDKAFDLLAGRAECSYALTKAIEANASAGSERFSAGHFEIRMYSESIHLYPQDPGLMDTLNRFVGRDKGWIPPTTSAPDENDAFWEQYKSAESFQKELLEAQTTKRTTVWRLLNDPHDERDENEKHLFNDTLDKVATEKGFDMKFNQLESPNAKHLAIL